MAAKSENNFSASALKALIAKYGKRIKCINTSFTKVLTNQNNFDLPYIDTDNIVTFDVDGYDVLECRAYDPFNRKEYTSVIRIGDVIGIVVADKETDTIDPFRC